MGQTGKRKGGCLAGIVLIGVVLAVGIRLAWPHEKRLMDVAHPMVAVKKEYYELNEDTYWVDSNRLYLVDVYDVQNPKGDQHYEGSSTQAKNIAKKHYAVSPPKTFRLIEKEQNSVEIEEYATEDYDVKQFLSALGTSCNTYR